MKMSEYMEQVVETIATLGNRGNDNFITAFHLAKGYLDDAVELEYKDTLRVDRQLRQGLEYYVQGTQWFDSCVRYRYDELIVLHNQNERSWK
jgi:hypothetical protein